jgi:hypothetical protein
MPEAFGIKSGKAPNFGEIKAKENKKLLNCAKRLRSAVSICPYKWFIMMFTHTRYFHTEYLNAIKKDLTYHGHWWLPNNRVAGMLYLNKKGGMKLLLMGMFDADIRNGYQFEFADHPIILGELIPGGAPVTLWACKEIQRKSPYIESTAKGTSKKFYDVGYFVWISYSESR